MEISDIQAAPHNTVFSICGSLGFEEGAEVQFWL